MTRITKHVLGRLFNIAFGFIIIAALFKLLPEKTPFTIFQFWTWDSVWQGVVAGWPLYVWGISFHVAINFFRYNGHTLTLGETFVRGTIISIWAGVTEEVYWRWILFSFAVWTLQLGAWLLGGFAGLDWMQWLHVHIMVPIANFLTLGYLHEHLNHPEIWAAGAALLYSNGKFRDGHAYQGPFGLVHAWFAGMFLFWIMFNHGLPAAIVVHFLFDFLVFATVAVDAAIEERVYTRRRFRW